MNPRDETVDMSNQNRHERAQARQRAVAKTVTRNRQIEHDRAGGVRDTGSQVVGLDSGIHELSVPA